jgi:hypothetical protein
MEVSFRKRDDLIARRPPMASGRAIDVRQPICGGARDA